MVFRRVTLCRPSPKKQLKGAIPELDYLHEICMQPAGPSEQSVWWLWGVASSAGSDSSKDEREGGWRPPPGGISTACFTPDRCWCITTEWIVDGLLYRPLWFQRSVAMGVSVPRVIDGFQVPLCVWFLQAWLHKGRLLLFGHDKASQETVRVYLLTQPIHSSPLYVLRLTKGERLSLWVSVFHVRKKVLIEAYGLWHRPTQLLPADSALWRLGRQNMFFFPFTLIMVSFPPKLGHQNPLFSICVIHEKNKDGFNASGGH